MSQRKHLSFELTGEQWAGVNQAMLACFARQARPRRDGAAHDSADRADQVNEALAIICRDWLVAQRQAPTSPDTVPNTEEYDHGIPSPGEHLSSDVRSRAR